MHSGGEERQVIEMTVRSKWKVSSLKFTEGTKAVLDADGKPSKDDRGYYVMEPCQLVTIEMFPVYGNGDPNHENTKFWQASPAGKLELNCVNESASAQFKVGHEYYVDFNEATPAA